MIRYALQCEAGHSFESWFRDADAFEAQSHQGAVLCPHCQSARVTKQIMAPAVAGGREGPESRDIAVAVPDESHLQLRAMIRALHAQVVANTVDVGEKFPEEVRRIHYGESEARAIRGKADLEEARALLEEGIGFLPLPPLPDERN